MKFIVIGDIMIDRYLVADVNRISPEAPVAIADVKFQYDVLGGAANCARNISTITGEGTVNLLGYFNPTDEAGREVKKLLIESGIYYNRLNSMKPTILKERIFARHQQLLRVDVEDKSKIFFDKDMISKEIDLDMFDYIVVSDYAKGVVTRELMDWIAPCADRIIIDPKPENWSLYPQDVLLVTPNEKEHETMRYHTPQNILVTKGDKGMSLHCERGKFWSKDIEATDVENVEVIGAGDTVAATMAVSLQRGVDIVRAARIANACAGYVVSQQGTAVVPKEVYEDIFIKNE